jgi:hypothetical protein
MSIAHFDEDIGRTKEGLSVGDDRRAGGLVLSIGIRRPHAGASFDLDLKPGFD